MKRHHLLGRAMDRPRLVWTAILAGQLAGLVFLAWLAVAHGTVLSPRAFRWPLDVIGAFVVGEGTLGQTGWLWFPGLLANQLGPALTWSLLFAWFALSPSFPRRLPQLLLLGLGIGLVAQFIDGYFVLPLLGQFLHGSNSWSLHIGWFWSWSAHLAYGLSLGWLFATLLPAIDRIPTRALH